MTDSEQQIFRRKIIGERVLLMLPLNVVMAARIRGAVDPEDLRKEVSGRSLQTKEQTDFWKYANGNDYEDVVRADSKLLMDLADKGGDFFKGKLSTIRCPVLFTGSLKDSFIPDIAEQNIRMTKQIQNSAVFLSNDGDHPFMWNCHELFRSVSYQFLKNLSELKND